MLRTAGLIALAFVAAHSAVFLLGRTLVPIAPSMTTIPGAPYGYDGPLPAATTTLDPAAALNVSFANDTFTARELAQLRMPLWNGHQGFGAPFLSSGHPAVLYPLTPLLTLLAHHQYEFLYLLNWYLAALFTFLYLRIAGIGETGALVGATAVVASGFFQYYLAFREASATAAWFPALLYVFERTLREPDWRWRHGAIALASYCVINAAQPEETALALTAVTFYGLASLPWREPRRAASLLAAFVPGALCAALISAPFWWNFSDYAFAAHSGHAPGSAAAQSTLGWRTLAAYVMPQLYGRPQTLPPEMVPAGWSWDLSPGWIPVAVSFGVVFGVWRAVASRSRPLLLVMAIAGAAAGRMWGIAPLTLISHLPLFDRVVYPRYAAFLLAFAAAILAGAGWEFALSRTPRQWLRAAAIWIGAAALLYLLTGIWRQTVFTAIQVRAFSALAWLWAIAVPAALWWLRRRDRLEGLTMAAVTGAAMILQLVAYMPGYPPETYLVLTVGCLGAWLLLALWAGIAPRRSPAVLLIIVTLVCAAPESVLALSDRRGLPRRYDAATPPPYAAMLHALQSATAGRAYAIDGTPQSNFATPLDLVTLNKCDPLQPSGAALFLHRRLDRGGDPICFSGNAGPRTPPAAIDEFRTNRRFFNLGAIRYLVTKTTAIHPNGEDPRMRLAAVDPATGVQIWEDLDAFPRAFMACPAVRVDSLDAAIEALPAVRDLRHEIVLEGGVTDPCTASRTPSGELASFEARASGIALRYRTDAPGMLVVADAFERGWTAADNGEPVPVVRIDGVFIGVPLARAGDHAIELSYRPPHWQASLTAAAAGAAGLAAFTLLPRRRHRTGNRS